MVQEGEEERRRRGGFVSLLGSKEVNVHAATEDLTLFITLKRVKTQRVRGTRGRYLKDTSK